VERKCDRAVFARRHLATAGAAHARGKATPVQKENDLIARAEGILDRAKERHADAPILGRTGPVAAEVYELDPWQRVSSRPIGEPQLLRPSRSGEVFALERRRRAAEHAYAACSMCAQNSHVARVITHTLFLLEARVVLFVDDHEREGPDRCEEGASRSDGHVHLALPESRPHPVAFASREARV